ncbi:Uncharacterized protein PRO82_000164 [Candidatus Protochlamydia amoebophila]|uniref:hypothetical protein n=1 Tax=Candidatus Protochlamydia amoebophila TaxID=362787 RepID=UPI001BC8ED20|nr:hypothetical protein [Candidatus Protochlamydia amoebophila]MBS4162886.1 Uncharacterized protein [Candidatus Protochlamydia amoebophila]
MLLLTLFAFLIGIVTVLSIPMSSILSRLDLSDRNKKEKLMVVTQSWMGTFLVGFWLLTFLVASFEISFITLRYTAVLWIAFCGLVLIFPTFTSLFAKFLEISLQNFPQIFSVSSKYNGLWGGLLGFLWSPIAWFFLAPLVIFVRSTDTIFMLLILALVYALGVSFSLCLFLYDLHVNKLTMIQLGEKLRLGMGLGLIILAVILAFNWNTFFGRTMLHDLPDMQIENHQSANQQLRSFDIDHPNFPNLSSNPFSNKLVKTSVEITPDIYLGYEQKNSFMQMPQLLPNIIYFYKDIFDAISLNQVALRGKWEARERDILSQSQSSQIKINFQAEQVYVLLGGKSLSPIQLIIDGKPLKSEYYTKDMNENGEIFVNQERLYQLLDLKSRLGRHELILTIPQGIKVYAFTFGANH